MALPCLLLLPLRVHPRRAALVFLIVLPHDCRRGAPAPHSCTTAAHRWPPSRRCAPRAGAAPARLDARPLWPHASQQRRQQRCCSRSLLLRAMSKIVAAAWCASHCASRRAVEAVILSMRVRAQREYPATPIRCTSTAAHLYAPRSHTSCTSKRVRVPQRAFPARRTRTPRRPSAHAAARTLAEHSP